MRRFVKLLICGALCCLPAYAGAAAPGTAADLLACMRANLPESLRAQDVTITAFDRAGAGRTLRGTLYARRNEGRVQAMLAVHEPADLGGSAYLAREVEGGGQEIYLYLPALGKVHRIRAQNIDASMLGTDLHYDDLKQLANAFAGTQPALEAPDSLDGRPVLVLSARAPAGQSARFDRVRAWVDQQTCVAVRVVFYRGPAAQREFRVPAGAIAKGGEHWYASRATMTDLETATHTDFNVLGLRTGQKVADPVFDPHLFYIGNN